MAQKVRKIQMRDLDLSAGQLTGAVIKVNPSSTVAAEYGDAGATSGMVLHAPRYAVGISISSTLARTAGTLTAEWTLGGVTQSETAVIDGTNTQYSYTEFATPVALSAGDVVAMNSLTATFAPSNANATITLFFSERNV